MQARATCREPQVLSHGGWRHAAGGSSQIRAKIASPFTQRVASRRRRGAFAEEQLPARKMRLVARKLLLERVAPRRCSTPLQSTHYDRSHSGWCHAALIRSLCEQEAIPRSRHAHKMPSTGCRWSQNARHTERVAPRRWCLGNPLTHRRGARQEIQACSGHPNSARNLRASSSV